MEERMRDVAGNPTASVFVRVPLAALAGAGGAIGDEPGVVGGPGLHLPAASRASGLSIIKAFHPASMSWRAASGFFSPLMAASLSTISPAGSLALMTLNLGIRSVTSWSPFLIVGFCRVVDSVRLFPTNSQQIPTFKEDFEFFLNFSSVVSCLVADTG